MATPLQTGQVVMVTGGSGFLGQHIVKLLQEKADHVKEVRIFDNKPFSKQLDYEERKPLISMVGDLCNAAAVTSAVEGVDAVIHAAALISFGTFPDMEGMEKVNVKGTQNVIQACLTQNVKHLVYTSTVDVVVGFDDIINGDESTPVPNKFLFPGYPDTKYRAECSILAANGTPLQAGGRHHLYTLALRPNVMYGELDPYFVTSGLRSAQKQSGTLYRVGDGSALFQPSYVGNMAWGHLVALQELERREEVGGQVYFLSDDTPLINSFKFMEPFLNDRGFNLSRRYIPYSMMYSILWPAEKIAQLLKPFWKMKLPAPLCSVIYINRKLYFSCDKATKELNYAPLYSYEESMKRSKPYYAKLQLEAPRQATEEGNQKNICDAKI